MTLVLWSWPLQWIAWHSSWLCKIEIKYNNLPHNLRPVNIHCHQNHHDHLQSQLLFHHVSHHDTNSMKSVHVCPVVEINAVINYCLECNHPKSKWYLQSTEINGKNKWTILDTSSPLTGWYCMDAFPIFRSIWYCHRRRWSSICSMAGNLFWFLSRWLSFLRLR